MEGWINKEKRFIINSQAEEKKIAVKIDREEVWYWKATGRRSAE